MLKTSPQNGFTIVELLVVIVVIAILASISYVAYANIKDRATDSVLISTANTVEKKVKLKSISEGKGSPSAAVSNLQSLRQYYELDSSLNSKLIITVTNPNGSCNVNLSHPTVCSDWSDPALEHDDVVYMSIQLPGTANPWCYLHSGVELNWTSPVDGQWNSIVIPDNPDDTYIGVSCAV